MADEKTEIHFDGGEFVVVVGDASAVVAQLFENEETPFTVASSQDAVLVNRMKVTYVRSIGGSTSPLSVPSGPVAPSKWT
jgi:hypothetical protein